MIDDARAVDVHVPPGDLLVSYRAINDPTEGRIVAP
jgi:hypothetical protein